MMGTCERAAKIAGELHAKTADADLVDSDSTYGDCGLLEPYTFAFIRLTLPCSLAVRTVLRGEGRGDEIVRGQACLFSAA